MKFKDQIHRVIELHKTPTRIISLVPSQTELLVDLGLEEQIVGVTKFCIHPSYLRKNKAVVGGTKTIKVEKIKTLKPDIILCNKEENTKEIVEICEKIAPTHVSDIFTLNDAKQLIKLYGELFQKSEIATNINTELDVKIADFFAFIKNKQTINVAYFIWKNPWMIAANNTFINYLLELNKFNNVFDSLTRYPEVTLQQLADKKPQFALLSSEPYPFKEKHFEEFKNININPILVDGEMFSWYGSRLLKAFDYFKSLHQQLR